MNIDLIPLLWYYFFMYRADVLPSTREYASRTLRRTIRNLGKMSARRARLERSPDKRIQVDTARLQSILPFESFKCHPSCSVALDTAIVGSDIDLATVITREPALPEQMQAFVDELRHQGFSASTQNEVDRFAEGDDMLAHISAQNALINFRTLAEVEESLAQEPLHHDNLVVIAGWEID